MTTLESHSDNQEIVVRIMLPHVDPATDVRLDVRDQALEIDVRHDDDGRREQVSHRVTLPPAVTEDDVCVTCTNDVLEIRVELQ